MEIHPLDILIFDMMILLTFDKALSYSNSVRRERGFTLIEMLVVVAIMAILTSVASVNFIGTRQRGRDSQRKSNLRQIQSALELYRADQGVYPATASFPACNGQLVSGTTVYMQRVPCDPQGGNYQYQAPGAAPNTTYCLRACLENAQDPQRDQQVYGSNNPSVGGCTLTNCASPLPVTSFTLLNP